MKARISFDLDLSEYSLANEDDVQSLIGAALIAPARKLAIKELHAVRMNGDLDPNSKAINMAKWFQRIKLTLCVDANMTVTALPNDAPISTTLPFETMQQDN